MRESVADTGPKWVEVDSVGVDKVGRVLIATDSDKVRLMFTDVVARHYRGRLGLENLPTVSNAYWLSVCH